MATIRQKRLAKILSEDTSKTKGEAMIQAGYSVLSATKPQLTIDTPNFQTLLDKYISDKLITKTHKQAFKATKLVTSPTGPDVELPDWQARLKAVELGYKVKGRMVENATQVNLEGIKIHVTNSKWEEEAQE